MSKKENEASNLIYELCNALNNILVESSSQTRSVCNHDDLLQVIHNRAKAALERVKR